MATLLASLVFVSVSGTVHAAFDDITAFREIYSSDRNASDCGSHFGCRYEDVADRVIKALASLPVSTTESVFESYLGDADAYTPSYLTSTILNLLRRQYGTEVDALDNVLGTFFHTNVTQYLDLFVIGGRSFDEISGEILGRLRRDAGIEDEEAGNFWSAITTMRSYSRNDVKDAMLDYTNKTIMSFTLLNEQQEYCQGLLDTVGELGELGDTTGYRDLNALFVSACRDILPRDTKTIPDSTARAAQVFRGYTTATSKCGSIKNKRVSTQLRNTLSSLRVVGGQTIAKGEYKFLATLRYKNSVICTATIVDATHVMTAAHCTAGSKTGDLSVAVGEFDITKKDGERVIKVKKIRNHPAYNDDRVINDISILTLTRSIAGIANAEPICLPRSLHCTRMDRRKCFVAGWGARAISGNRLVYPRAPRDGTVYAYHGAKCPYRPKPTQARSQMCATGPSDTCNGDSGGPLFCQWGKKWTQCGITSFGPSNCNAKNTNGIYTHVTRYRAWLKKALTLS